MSPKADSMRFKILPLLLLVLATACSANTDALVTAVENYHAAIRKAKTAADLKPVMTSSFYAMIEKLPAAEQERNIKALKQIVATMDAAGYKVTKKKIVGDKGVVAMTFIDKGKERKIEWSLERENGNWLVGMGPPPE